MSTHSRRRLVGCLLLLAMALGAVIIAPTAGAADIKKTPKKYYLALGDSLAFGYQQSKFVACLPTGCATPDSLFSTGYVDDFTTHMQTIKPDIQTVNEGCPGATSTELISTVGCVTYTPSVPFPLHHPYASGSSQLQDAIAFLQANAGKVSPITLNIGPNDILRQITACGGLGNPAVLACLAAAAPALFNTIATNVGSTLAQLRAAAPDAKIVLVGLYNPYAVVPGFGASNGLAIQLNSILANVAANATAEFANPFPVINASSATVCAYTLMCTASPDIHASDAGYQQIADLIWNASGYANVN